MAHKILNLVEELEKSKYNPIKEWSKALKKKDYKKATAIAKIFQYIMVKPNKADEAKKADVDKLVIVETCQYLENCTYCQQANQKHKDELLKQLEQRENI